MGDLKALKGNELYLRWLEKNHGRLDLNNQVVAMNLYSNDEALSLSNEKKKKHIRNKLSERKFTLNGSLSPVHYGGAMRSGETEFLLPQINSLKTSGADQMRAQTERIDED